MPADAKHFCTRTFLKKWNYQDETKKWNYQDSPSFTKILKSHLTSCSSLLSFLAIGGRVYPRAFVELNIHWTVTILVALKPSLFCLQSKPWHICLLVSKCTQPPLFHFPFSIHFFLNSLEEGFGMFWGPAFMRIILVVLYSFCLPFEMNWGKLAYSWVTHTAQFYCPWGSIYFLC